MNITQVEHKHMRVKVCWAIARTAGAQASSTDQTPRLVYAPKLSYYNSYYRHRSMGLLGVASANTAVGESPKSFLGLLLQKEPKSQSLSLPKQEPVLAGAISACHTCVLKYTK
jgi:hypothetical protein